MLKPDYCNQDILLIMNRPLPAFLLLLLVLFCNVLHAEDCRFTQDADGNVLFSIDCEDITSKSNDAFSNN